MDRQSVTARLPVASSPQAAEPSSPKSGPLAIGQVARRGGVSVETVRFYERQGLIDEPPRKQSGYRQYPEDAVRRIRFARRARELGFSLREIKELLSLRFDPKAGCADVKRRAETKIADIAARIGTLQRMKRALTRLAAACSGRGSVDECPILQALDSEEDR